MKKNCIILLILIISSASAKKNNAYVGEIPDSKYLNVDDFVNRNFFGGETVKIRTKGFASIDNRGKADAISRALDSAQRNAVEETVGTLIESDTLVQNNVLIRDEVYEKTYGYIESYKVLEIKEIDNVMYAEIEAFVGVDMIEDNLMGRTSPSTQSRCSKSSHSCRGGGIKYFTGNSKTTVAIAISIRGNIS
jgi:hypothetical protein